MRCAQLAAHAASANAMEASTSNNVHITASSFRCFRLPSCGGGRSATSGLIANVRKDRDKASAFAVAVADPAGLRIAEELALWTEVVESLCRLGQNSLDGGNTAQARQFSERALRISADHSYHCGEFQARRQLDDITRAEPAWTLLRTS